MSKIEWTEKTWNPIVGCSIVSPGCTNCYAMKMASRILNMNAGRALNKARIINDQFLDYGTLEQRHQYLAALKSEPSHYDGTIKHVNGKPVWTGKLAMAPDTILAEPFRRKKPAMWFVNSMSDLFHEDVPDEWIHRVFAIMALTPRHTYQVLTKRSDRMREYCNEKFGRLADVIMSMRTDKSCVGPLPHMQPGAAWWPLPNVWLGVSCEDQKRADGRIPDLLATPAAVRFVSMEPLLRFVDMKRWLPAGRPAKRRDGTDVIVPQFFMTRCEHCGWTGSSELCPLSHNVDDADVVCPSCQKIFFCDEVAGIDWVIVGGESGNGARPMHLEWAESIISQCVAAGVSCFVKQLGSRPVFKSAASLEPMPYLASTNKGGDPAEWPDALRVREMPNAH